VSRVLLALDGMLVQRLVNDIGALVTASEQRGEVPVLLVSGPLRLPLRRLLRSSFAQLPVIGFAEAIGTTHIETVGQVSRGHEFAA
jgi:flagellar biosynthesis protein FlhA